ncbi:MULTISPECIES: conjugal transfer protein TraF [unclassified Oleiphilus]|uniref:conjugal transfer protein TraF n=5 Tax=Oleiphilus TaxID=141450 RepID=UPI0007C24EB4|nr:MULTISPECIES: conjugal transfer protein TraF [unclassified Oleiphilus]KZY42154.1 hypothetical protein A3732_02620 [Oleiphilus sp. HI0050]KZZ31099.1 hypothetical protein A3756_07465 [Oleiphilus sp. HI0086]KZZ37813.1 hypothetical protein A3757_00135 [Oleiphilus sp. HI0117]
MKQKTLQRTKLARGVALAVLLGGATSAVAGYQGYQPGALKVLGKTTHPNTLLAIGNNPASGESLINDEENFRMGYFSSFGIDIEAGQVDNFIDEVDELSDALDNEDLTLGEALDIKEKFDDLLPKFGEDARLTIGLGLHVPFFPMALRTDFLGGVLGLDVHASGLFDVSFLDAPLDIQITGSDVELLTASALYVKGASLVTGSLSYSAEVWQPPVMDSKLFAGVQLNAYHATMNKQVLALTNIAEDDDAGDAIRDEFEENTVSTTEMGVDLGLLWAFPNGHAGLTIANINEPEFKYGDIGTDCGSITDPTRRANCEVARDVFSGEISLQETAVMAAQTTIEGSLYTEDKQWLLTGAYDLNSVYDLVGRESQMISGSATYFPNSYILPTIRLGISQNLVGSELTMVGFGTTLFGMMNIDLAASLDTVELDGTKAPRRFGFNIGFEEKF